MIEILVPIICKMRFDRKNKGKNGIRSSLYYLLLPSLYLHINGDGQCNAKERLDKYLFLRCSQGLLTGQIPTFRSGQK